MRRPAPSRGFALAAVLWLLAGVTILVSGVGVSLLAVARTNRDLDARVRLIVAEQQATASLLYVMLTSKTLGVGANVGAAVLPLDGSVSLAMDNGAVVELQDLQGLIGLNAASGEDLRRLVGQCGANAEQADSLVDRLLDYTDEDSLKRTNGAEAFEYASIGRAPPRNRALTSRAELRQVLGWETFRSAWVESGCDELVSLSSAAAVNLWTAPERVLTAMGMDPRSAALATSERGRDAQLQRLSPLLLSFRDLQGTGPAAMGRFSVRSRGDVRLTVTLPPSGLARRVVIFRGGVDHVVPFLISEQDWVPAKSDAADVDQAPGMATRQLLLEGYVSAAAARTETNALQTPLLPFQRP